MFGYMAVSLPLLSKEDQQRYRAYYCGLCRALKCHYGQKSRLTLSNDLTFLSILLTSLYEPKEEIFEGRCPLHPLKKREYIRNSALSYGAAMNILLTYHKLLDNRKDEKNILSGAGARALKKAYRKVERQYGEKCADVQKCLDEIAALEKQESRDVDALCNLSGQMLGEIFAWKADAWAEMLRQIGEGLGRFIYFMDAYEDYDADVKNGRFNPLKELHQQPDYEELCLDTLKMLVAEAVEAFEMLPLEKELSILHHVMYTGIWAHYARMHKDERKEKEHPDE